MKKTNIVLMIMLAFTGLALYIVSLEQLPPDFESIRKVHYIYTTYSLFFMGAAVFFWLSLRSFNTLFKRAFGYIVAGLALIGFTQLQIPIFQSLQAFDNPWIAYGGLIVPFAVALMLIYSGAKRFAALLDIKTWAASWRVTLPLLASGIIAALILPHQSEVESEALYRWSLSVFFVIEILNILSTIVIFKVQSVVGRTYRAGITLLGVGLLLFTLTYAQGIYFELTTYEIPYVMEGYYPLFQLLSSLVFLAAGYIFMFTTSPHIKKVADFTPNDIIIYVVGFVSNPKAIDTYLDPMREITARSSSNDLSAADQQSLQQIYLRIEEYLTTKEPVRRYTREELRNRVATQFDLEHHNSTFWSTLP